jgi:hypothetical protein
MLESWTFAEDDSAEEQVAPIDELEVAADEDDLGDAAVSGGGCAAAGS